jgi:hypothetical protein
MTPYELMILLEVYVGSGISARTDMTLFRETMERFIEEGWVADGIQRPYSSTPKLNAFFKFVLDLPAPVQEWRMPELRALKGKT